VVHWRLKMGSQPRLIEVRKNVLKQNDLTARALREQFRAAGVFVVSLVSSPGSGQDHVFGKDAHSAPSALPRSRALSEDLATENDAIRLARSGPRLSKSPRARFVILKPQWSRTRLQEWISTNLISCL